LIAVPFLPIFGAFTPPTLKHKYFSISFLNLSFSISRVGRYRTNKLSQLPSVLADVSFFVPAATHGSAKSGESL
jgi:hypothetical protein